MAENNSPQRQRESAENTSPQRQRGSDAGSRWPAMGLVFDIQHYAVHDGPGIRTLVFLNGCPLQCPWCCNPESQAFQPQLRYVAVPLPAVPALRGVLSPSGHCSGASGPVIDRTPCQGCESWRCLEQCPGGALLRTGRNLTATEVIEEVAKDVDFYRNSGGGVTFSGGEPFAQPAFLLELLLLSQGEWHLDCRGNLRPHPAGAPPGGRAGGGSFPLRPEGHGSLRHAQLTGRSNDLILSNLELLARLAPGKITIRHAVIPGCNDDALNQEAIAHCMNSLGLRSLQLEPYHPLGEDKYAELGRRTPVAPSARAGTRADGVAENVLHRAGLELRVRLKWLPAVVRRICRLPQAEADQTGQPTGQQRGDRIRAGVRGIGREAEAQGAYRRSQADAQADHRFVQSAVFALGFADVHRVEQRRIVNQSDRDAEDRLRGDEQPEVVRKEQEAEAGHQPHKGPQQPAEAVVPAGPLPESDEGAQADKHPDRAEQPRLRRGQAQRLRQGRDDGHDGRDPDVGEGNRQPHHVQKGLRVDGPGNGGRLQGMGRCRGRRGGRRLDRVLAQPQDDQELAAVHQRRQPEDAGVPQRFVERAANEIHRRHPRRPDDVVEADVLRQDVIAKPSLTRASSVGQVKHIVADQPANTSRTAGKEGNSAPSARQAAKPPKPVFSAVK